MTIKVSIITVVFNNVTQIQECIDSVLLQTYTNIEHIIVDGGSTDGTLEVIKKNKHLTKVISGKDKGLYDAMNKGLLLTEGQLIGILNSDDKFLPHTVQKVVETYTKNHCEVISGAMIQTLNGVVLKTFYPTMEELYKTMTLYHPSTFISKKLYDEVGIYDLRYKYASDYDLILRCFKHTPNFCLTNDVFTIMRLGGLSDHHWHATLKETFHIKSKYRRSSIVRIENLIMFLKEFFIRKVEKYGLKSLYIFYRKNFRKDGHVKYI